MTQTKDTTSTVIARDDFNPKIFVIITYPPLGKTYPERQQVLAGFKDEGLAAAFMDSYRPYPGTTLHLETAAGKVVHSIWCKKDYSHASAFLGKLGKTYYGDEQDPRARAKGQDAGWVIHDYDSPPQARTNRKD